MLEDKRYQFESVLDKYFEIILKYSFYTRIGGQMVPNFIDFSILLIKLLLRLWRPNFERLLFPKFII